MFDPTALSEALLAADAAHTPVDPLTASAPALSVEDAYRVQLASVKARIAKGRRIIGKKIGLTSKAMQDLLGVREPDYGHLLDDMLLLEDEPCKRSELILPKVEGEVAFVLKSRLRGPGVHVADVLRATEGVMASLEIVDSRIRDWKIKLADTVADNASSARLVLGSRLRPAHEFDLRRIGMYLAKNGQVVNSGAGIAVWGHPAAAVAWLANKLAAFDVALEPGEIRALRRRHRCGERRGGRRRRSPLRPARVRVGPVRLGARRGGGMVPKLKVAVIGPGNIGTDLMYKILRSPASDGDDGGHRGVGGDPPRAFPRRAYDDRRPAADPRRPGISIVFDATSAKAHIRNARALAAAGQDRHRPDAGRGRAVRRAEREPRRASRTRRTSTW